MFSKPKNVISKITGARCCASDIIRDTGYSKSTAYHTLAIRLLNEAGAV